MQIILDMWESNTEPIPKGILITLKGALHSTLARNVSHNSTTDANYPV